MKYIDRLNQKGSEQEQQEENQLNAEDALNSLSDSKTKTKRKISALKRELKFLKSAVPFDASAIIDKQLEMESFEQGLERLLTLEKELF